MLNYWNGFQALRAHLSADEDLVERNKVVAMY